MNTKMKIAAGIAAGAIAGTTLVGTAFAAPNALTAVANDTYGAVRSLDTSATFVRPTIEQMSAFMNRFRNANGTFGLSSMRAAMGWGTATPSSGTCPAPRAGYGTMHGSTATNGPVAGMGMMGSRR